jgi:hypothetical protein
MSGHGGRSCSWAVEMFSLRKPPLLVERLGWEKKGPIAVAGASVGRRQSGMSCRHSVSHQRRAMHFLALGPLSPLPASTCTSNQHRSSDRVLLVVVLLPFVLIDLGVAPSSVPPAPASCWSAPSLPTIIPAVARFPLSPRPASSPHSHFPMSEFDTEPEHHSGSTDLYMSAQTHSPHHAYSQTTRRDTVVQLETRRCPELARVPTPRPRPTSTHGCRRVFLHSPSWWATQPRPLPMPSSPTCFPPPRSTTPLQHRSPLLTSASLRLARVLVASPVPSTKSCTSRSLLPSSRSSAL